jgi:hypothetical protein
MRYLFGSECKIDWNKSIGESGVVAGLFTTRLNNNINISGFETNTHFSQH